MKDENSDVVMPAEAARLAGVPLATLRRWAQAGKVPTVVTTAGGHRRFARADMAAVRESMEGLTVAEVAALFHVEPRTVARWVAERRLAAKKTPGGDLRFRPDDVETLRKGGGSDAS